jgi:PAS domain S-box-containing protein
MPPPSEPAMDHLPTPPLLPPLSARDERKMLEFALVTAFLENIPDGVYFKDRNSRFIAVSRSKAIRHGYPQAADLVGKTDADFFSEAHAARARLDEENIMRTGTPILSKVEKITWPDGRSTWARSSKLPLRTEEGRIIGTFGMSQDITAAKEMEAALEKANKEIMDASRMAGMAEVATGVLHNVGNVLNSLNVSATVIATGVRQSKADSLARVSALLREHAGHLADFLANDPKGRLVPDFLESLARHGAEERVRLLQEIDSLQKNIDHIKEIVSMQQAYATMVGVVEPLDAAMLMEDSIRMNSAALVRHHVSLVRDFQPVPAVFAERGKVLQILINLIRNAKYALDEGRSDDRTITLRVQPGESGFVRFVVQDNGVGIARENLNRIFNHGFTTRQHGHGFGLHSSALAAKEMHGAISVASDGPGQGAAFILELPVADPAVVGLPATAPAEAVLA